MDPEKRDLKNARKNAQELKKWITKYWGKKCPDFDKTCHLCMMWKSFETIQDGIELGEDG